VRILQISTADILGGAERVAWDLFQAYRDGGHSSWLAVGTKHSKDPDIWPIPNPDWQSWKSVWRVLHSRLATLEKLPLRGIWRARQLAGELAQPGSWRERRRGLQDFRFAGTRRLLELPPKQPDIVHCHNLHRDYFDLRVLPQLSRQVPVVLTLHDAWLLSGLCWHSLDCERWKIGCGKCPQLALLQNSPHDATHVNWRRKAQIFAQCRLFITTPCRWLMYKVEQSIVAPAMVSSRVIPNGIDLTVFQPRDQQAARASLGIPPDGSVFLYIARGMLNNPSKDYLTIRGAVARVAAGLRARPVLFLALGDEAPTERLGNAEVRFVPFQADPAAVAAYYHAADVYLHAANADTFPLSVLEALACSTPVVATAVGGIPEQVKSLNLHGEIRAGTAYGRDEATGILVPPKDADAMAAAMVRLVNDDDLRTQLGHNAVRDARERFDLQRQVSANLAWYAELRTGSTRRQPTLAG
jgi:glycosyltransferase involved in cell wall biosynthesis